jgi:hypothetical protein
MRRVHPTIAVCSGVSLAAALCVACGPSQYTNYFVPNLQIDSQQRLIPVGPQSLQHPGTDSYYMFFHGAFVTSVDHFARRKGTTEFRRLFYLESDNKQGDRLESTVKTEDLVTGSVVAIVSRKTCFYNRPVDTYRPSVQVLMQSMHPDIEEIPDQVPPPESPGELTSAAIVRWRGTSPQYAIAIGNYESNGTLGSIDQGITVNGDVQPGSSYGVPDAPELEKARRDFSLPLQFDLESYLHARKLSPSTSDLGEQTIVILTYGYGKLFRQDNLENGMVVSSRFLKPGITQEEGVLGPQCDQQLHEQKAAGKWTVW